MMTGRTENIRVNLVPDVKLQMIKCRKCVTSILHLYRNLDPLNRQWRYLGSIQGHTGSYDFWAGEDHINKLSDKVTTYKELPDF